MENKDYGEVIGNRDAAYVNGLAKRYALATASFGVRHPSLPNYLALTGGATFGVASDCTTCEVKARNVVDQLESAGLSWKAYMEDLPSPCFRGAAHQAYAKKHDPFIYYRDIAHSPQRCSRIVPLRELGTDLRAGRLPTFLIVRAFVQEGTYYSEAGSEGADDGHHGASASYPS